MEEDILKDLLQHYCVCLKSRTLRNCISSSSFLHQFSGIAIIFNGEFGEKIYFTAHWTANTIQFSYCCHQRKFFLVHYFSESVASEGELPRDYLINAATCLFAKHRKIHYAMDKNLSKAVKILVSEQINFTVIFLLWGSFRFWRLWTKHVGMVAIMNM